MIPFYQEKKHYLIRHQNYRCAIQEDFRKNGKIIYSRGLPELHHKLHNTKPNRKRYPNYINSLWNLAAVSHDLHMQYPGFGKITLLEADRREAFLIRHPRINKFMNKVR
jgi:hypothetical protein